MAELFTACSWLGLGCCG